MEVTGEELGKFYYGTPDGVWEIYRQSGSSSDYWLHSNRTGETRPISANAAGLIFKDSTHILTPWSLTDLETGEVTELNLETEKTGEEALTVPAWAPGDDEAIWLERTPLGIGYHENSTSYVTLSVFPARVPFTDDGKRVVSHDNSLWLDFYSEDGSFLRSIKTPCMAGYFENVRHMTEPYYFYEGFGIWGDFALFYDYNGVDYSDYARIACVNLYDGSLWYMDGILFRFSGDRIIVLNDAYDEYGRPYLQVEQYEGGERMCAYWKQLDTDTFPIDTWYMQYRPYTNILHVDGYGEFDFAAIGGSPSLLDNICS